MGSLLANAPADTAHGPQPDGGAASATLAAPICWLAPPLPWAAVTFICILIAGWPSSRPLYADSIAYRALALGHYDQVMGSIAGRILHPACVRFVASVFGLKIDDAFFAVAVGALFVFVATMAYLLRQVTGVGALVLPLLFTPVVVHDMFGLYYCQHLFYAALLALFFTSMARNRLLIVLGLLLPLYLARESTLILSLVVIAVALSESDLRLLGGCAIVSLTGLWISRIFASLGQPNVHHTSELAFLTLKPPFDLMRTLFGIVMVPTEMQGRPGFTCAPFATMHLPNFLRYGFTSEFGICRPDPAIPIHTFTLWLSLFGIGPAVVAMLVWRGRRRFLSRDIPRWARVALLYGAIAYLLAPAVSFWLERDIGYAWPALWIAAPYFVLNSFGGSPKLTAALLVENFAASWIPYWLSLDSATISLLPALAIASTMQVFAIMTIAAATSSAPLPFPTFASSVPSKISQ